MGADEIVDGDVLGEVVVGVQLRQEDLARATLAVAIGLVSARKPLVAPTPSRWIAGQRAGAITSRRSAGRSGPSGRTRSTFRAGRMPAGHHLGTEDEMNSPAELAGAPVHLAQAVHQIHVADGGQVGQGAAEAGQGRIQGLREPPGGGGEALALARELLERGRFARRCAARRTRESAAASPCGTRPPARPSPSPACGRRTRCRPRSDRRAGRRASARPGPARASRPRAPRPARPRGPASSPGPVGPRARLYSGRGKRTSLGAAAWRLIIDFAGWGSGEERGPTSRGGRRRGNRGPVTPPRSTRRTTGWAASSSPSSPPARPSESCPGAPSSRGPRRRRPRSRNAG
jgi:hypothetical protein